MKLLLIAFLSVASLFSQVPADSGEKVVLTLSPAEARAFHAWIAAGNLAGELQTAQAAIDKETADAQAERDKAQLAAKLAELRKAAGAKDGPIKATPKPAPGTVVNIPAKAKPASGSTKVVTPTKGK